MSRARDIANSVGAGSFVSVGTIFPFGNGTLPTGYLACDGSAVSRTTYSDLFGVIGTDYGVGDGSTTFNVPDLQDKVPVGSSGTKAIASTGGSATQTPTGTITVNNHTLSTSEIPAHGHSITANAFAGNLGLVQCPVGGDGNKYGTGDDARDASSETARYVANNTGSGGAHNHGGSFSGSSMSVEQPYVAMKFMIKH